MPPLSESNAVSSLSRPSYLRRLRPLAASLPWTTDLSQTQVLVGTMRAKSIQVAPETRRITDGTDASQKIFVSDSRLISTILCIITLHHSSSSCQTNSHFNLTNFYPAFALRPNALTAALPGPAWET